MLNMLGRLQDRPFFMQNFPHITCQIRQIFYQDTQKPFFQVKTIASGFYR